MTITIKSTTTITTTTLEQLYKYSKAKQKTVVIKFSCSVCAVLQKATNVIHRTVQLKHCSWQLSSGVRTTAAFLAATSNQNHHTMISSLSRKRTDEKRKLGSAWLFWGDSFTKRHSFPNGIKYTVGQFTTSCFHRSLASNRYFHFSTPLQLLSPSSARLCVTVFTLLFVISESPHSRCINTEDFPHLLSTIPIACDRCHTPAFSSPLSVVDTFVVYSLPTSVLFAHWFIFLVSKSLNLSVFLFYPHEHELEWYMTPVQIFAFQ